jgi:hypothetical protein
LSGSDDSVPVSHNGLNGESIVELRKFYKKKLGSKTLHHLVPRSRKGQGNEYNLFPWTKGPHSAWHTLFWNMTIVEIWSSLEMVHSKIFEARSTYVLQSWIDVCELEIGDKKKRKSFYADKKDILSKHVKVRKLVKNWRACFGGTDIQQARALLKQMMLFMIFGSRITDSEEIKNTQDNARSKSIFVNGNMSDFLNNFPDSGIRHWAFCICFGNNASINNIKAKIKKIRHNK